MAEKDRNVFVNRTCDCIGTGRMDLALQAEYQEELRAVQTLCHFRHIRGHGLFSEGMAIYAPYMDADGVEHAAYNFTYLDRVMDFYRSVGLAPILELGFMPEKLSSGPETIFYWKGHVTPPNDEEKWKALVRATLSHLCARYGREEVETWPVEVWNEPNLRGFWKDADKQAYFRLYEITVQAVRDVSPCFQVGGPVICGGDGSLQWIRDFLRFCEERALPLDYVSRHTYMGQTPEHAGRYLYHDMNRPEDVIAELEATRDVMKEFPRFRDLPLYITEFNTSYNPFCPIHDTLYNAVLISGLLLRMGRVADSYSYWTFGDVFEEQGVPSRLFHGGFGLMAQGCIPKPTLWAFHFFAGLRGETVCVRENSVMVRDGDAYTVVAWNPGRETAEETWHIPMTGPACVMRETVDEDHGNPLKVWLAMGQPQSLSADEERLVRESAVPGVRGECCTAGEDGLDVKAVLSGYALTRIRVQAQAASGDYGYSVDRYL